MSDIRLIPGVDGTDIQIANGIPLTDNGLENRALISLFTSPGWCGNSFMSDPLGSIFEQVCNQPITRQSINNIRNAGLKALSDPIFGDVTVDIKNPTGQRLNITFTSNNGLQLQLIRDNGVWQQQATDTAYRKIKG